MALRGFTCPGCGEAVLALNQAVGQSNGCPHCLANVPVTTAWLENLQQGIGTRTLHEVEDTLKKVQKRGPIPRPLAAMTTDALGKSIVNLAPGVPVFAGSAAPGVPPSQSAASPLKPRMVGGRETVPMRTLQLDEEHAARSGKMFALATAVPVLMATLAFLPLWNTFTTALGNSPVLLPIKDSGTQALVFWIGIGVAATVSAALAKPNLRGWLMLGIGLAPLAWSIVTAPSLLKEPTLMLFLFWLVATIAAYGGSAAVGHFPTTPMILNTAALGGAVGAGLVLYALSYFSKAPIPGGVGLVLSTLLLVLGCAAPVVAAFCYVGNSPNAGRTVPILYWLTHVAGLPIVAAVYGAPFELAGTLFITLAVLFGSLFIAGVGVRDLLVETELAKRRQQVAFAKPIMTR